jgi:NSS family neurotransmitter:Na+ symporter
MQKTRTNWSSRLGFILVTASATIGFGNIWRFPYLVGENGGGAFVLVFLLCVLLIGLPLVMAEMVIGRHSSKNIIDTFRIKNSPKIFYYMGYIGIIAAFLMLSYYVVLAGWVSGYIGLISFGSLDLSVSHGADYYAGFFKDFIAKPYLPLIFTAIYLFLNYIILVFDLKIGVERTSRYLVPLLFIIMFIMIVKSISLPNSFEGVKFYLSVDFSKISFNTFLIALGQTFFSLSIGYGTLITFSSYSDKKTSITNVAIWVVILDTLVAIMAGFIIFPAIFAFGMEPAAGSGLIFNVLPAVFAKMMWGDFFAIIFFIILLIAALTTSISVFEVIITTLVEKLNITRPKAALISIVGVFIFGSIPSSFSYGILDGIKIVGLNIFEAMDYLSGNILFIFNGFIAAVFCGFILKDSAIKELLAHKYYDKNPLIFKLWHIGIKYVATTVIIIIFLTSLFFVSST